MQINLNYAFDGAVALRRTGLSKQWSVAAQALHCKTVRSDTNPGRGHRSGLFYLVLQVCDVTINQAKGYSL